MAIQVSTVRAVVNGVTVDLVANGDGTFTGRATAPNASSYPNNAGHYFPVAITATYETGNETTVDDTNDDPDIAQACRLFVKEVDPPAVETVYPSSGTTIGKVQDEKIVVVFKDKTSRRASGYSGIDKSKCKIHIETDSGAQYDVDENTAMCTVTEEIVSGEKVGYRFTYSDSEGGAIFENGTVTYYGYAEDYDGNKTTGETVRFKVDTAPPDISITYPNTSSIKIAQDNITLIGQATDDLSAPITVKISVTGQSDITLTNVTGEFSQLIEFPEPGVYTITVVATDSAGVSADPIVRTVEYSDDYPVITNVVIEPVTSVAGVTQYTITCTVV